MSGFRIWRGGVNDADTLAALHAPSFPDAWPAEAFRSLIARDGVTVLIGVDDEGSPRGFILVQCVAGEAEVLTFCVAEAFRRSGLGRSLLAAALALAAEQGAEQMFLEVGEGNGPALRLYRRAGFGEVGRRAAYYHHGLDASDAIVMRKVLNQAAP